MGAIRTLTTNLVLRATDAVKGLKAYDKLWKSVEKSVAASASAIERSSDRAVAALQRMGDAAAIARAAGAGAGSGGRSGGGGGSGGLRAARSTGSSSPPPVSADARRRSAASMDGIAAGAKTVNEATVALGRFASAEERARAKVADLTAQVQRNREEMARLRRQAVETGDADGTLTARMRGLAAQTGVTSQQLARARGELRGVTGGLLDAVKAAASFKGGLGALQVAAGNLISGGLSRLAGAAAGALGESAKMAMNFEKSLVDVAKVAKDVDLKDGLLDPRIKQGIKDTAKELGVMPEQVAALTAQVTASFSGKTDIVALAKDVTKIGVAWDITGQQAGEYFKQTSAGLQLNAEETKALFGSINQLGNELGIKSSEIAEAMTRSAGVIKGANLSGETGAALNATLIKAGASAEVAATGVRTFIARLGAGEAATDKQRKAFTALGLSAESVAKNLSSGDAAQAEKQIKDVVAALVQMGEKSPDKRLATLIELFGSESIGSIGAAATATETLASAFDIAGNKAAALTSVQAEYDRVSNTTAARVDKLKANIGVLAIEFGEALLPQIDKVVEFLTSPEGQEWGKGAVEKMVAAVSSLASAIGVVVNVLADLVNQFGGATIAAVAFGVAISALTGPIGLVAAAGVAMGAALVNAFMPAETAFDRFISKANEAYSSLLVKINEVLTKTRDAAKEANAAMSKENDRKRALLEAGFSNEGQEQAAREAGGRVREKLLRGRKIEKLSPEERANIKLQVQSAMVNERLAYNARAEAVGSGKAAPELSGPGGADKAAGMDRFNELVRMRNADPDGLDPAEAEELRSLSKSLNRAIPKKPGKGRTHKQTKMDRQLAAVDPSVRAVLTGGGETDKGGDLKVHDDPLSRAVFDRQNKANGAGGASGGLGSVGPGPNIANHYTYVTTNVDMDIDARGNGDAATNLAASASEVATRVGEVRFTGANRIIGQRNMGGVRRGPA